MPIQRHRRIFRSGPSHAGRPRGSVGRTVVVGLLSALGAAAVMTISLPSDLFGRVPTLSGTINADAPMVAVVDGGTLRLRDTVVRLLGIDAPARGQACGAGAARFDCGSGAAQALASLVRDHVVACHLSGRDSAGFPLAQCEAGGADLNRALVAQGWAKAGTVELSETEAVARSQRLGVWRNGAAAAF